MISKGEFQMKSNMWWRGLLALVVLVGLVAGAVLIYNAGVAQGTATPGDFAGLRGFRAMNPFFALVFTFFGLMFLLRIIIPLIFFPIFGWRRWGGHGHWRRHWGMHGYGPGMRGGHPWHGKYGIPYEDEELNDGPSAEMRAKSRKRGRGPWGWGDELPPMFQEWHEKAHQAEGENADPETAEM
jgi:hypothetical protein